MSRRRAVVCPTGKRVYRTRARAERTLRSIWAGVHPGRKLETRAYRCEWCDRWHLTSQPRRTA